VAGLEWDPIAARRGAAKAHVPIVRGSVNAAPFADGAFDAIVAADVLCHAAVEPARALAELRRMLRRGGRLIINMPAYAWLMSGHDRRVHNARRMSAGEVRAMLVASRFTPERVIYWNTLLLPLMIARRKIAAGRHNSASDVALPSPWLDAMLYAVTNVERAMPFDLPAGGSVLAVAKRG
jgi:SAM-dependent methyltransferase